MLCDNEDTIDVVIGKLSDDNQNRISLEIEILISTLQPTLFRR
jgi:hypothetical protein